MLSSTKSYINRKVSLTIHCKYRYFDSTVQRAEDRRQKFYFCRLPFAVIFKLNLSTKFWIKNLFFPYIRVASRQRYHFKLESLLANHIFFENRVSIKKTISSFFQKLVNFSDPFSMPWQIKEKSNKVNKLTSVFYASVLLLIMNFIIALSK